MIPPRRTRSSTAALSRLWCEYVLPTLLDGYLPGPDVPFQSVRCNLKGASAAELVNRHEEPEEFGGYFIVNGIERLIRYLILPRANHVVALVRPSFVNRGPSYTPYAVQIRAVRPDQTSVTNSLHYLSNGSATFRFSWRKQEYVIPIMLILKALVSASDREIFEGIMMQDYENTFLTDRVELLLRSFKTYSLYTGTQCLEYIGSKFRVVLGQADDMTNRELGVWWLKKIVLVHLENLRDKFRMLLRVLITTVRGQVLTATTTTASCSGSCLPSSQANAPQTIQIHRNTSRFSFQGICMG